MRARSLQFGMAVVVFGLCLLTGCRHALQPLPAPPIYRPAHQRDSPPVVAVAEVSADATTASISVGEVMQISVEENTTTGYHWKVVGINPKTLKQLAYVVQPDKSSNSAIPPAGSGGITTLQFQGVAPGQTDLKINYAPFYSSDPKQIAQKVRIKVTVTAGHV